MRSVAALPLWWYGDCRGSAEDARWRKEGVGETDESATNVSVPWSSAGDVLAGSWPVPRVPRCKNTRELSTETPTQAWRQAWRSHTSSVAGPWH